MTTDGIFLYFHSIAFTVLWETWDSIYKMQHDQLCFPWLINILHIFIKFFEHVLACSTISTCYLSLAWVLRHIRDFLIFLANESVQAGILSLVKWQFLLVSSWFILIFIGEFNSIRSIRVCVREYKKFQFSFPFCDFFCYLALKSSLNVFECSFPLL